MMEYQEAKNQDNLVKELTPSLHEESHGDFSTTMEAY
jgi:hypothetical protein